MTFFSSARLRAKNEDSQIAAPLKNITQTLIIPQGSKEHFVVFRDGTDSNEWFGNGVLLSGISHLKNGYLVHRPECKHHFLGYVFRGKANYWNGESNVEIKPGHLFFLPANGLQHYESHHTFSMIWFHLNQAHSRWCYLTHRSLFHRAAQCLNETHNLMDQALTESHSPLSKTDRVGESLCRLILAYLDREFEQDDSETSLIMRDRLEKVWREASRNLANDWNVTSLARLAGMSPSHFHAAVKTMYQIPPMHIIRNFRMNQAQALLLNTNDKLESIAERTGYQSAFSLSRIFRATLGVSPSHYRQQHRKEK